MEQADEFLRRTPLDDGKVLLDGVTLPPGQTRQQDLEAAITNIANNESVAPFISRQLIQRLVTSNPSPAYVGRVAAKFNNNGSNVRGDLKAVIRTILLDPEARRPTAGTASGHGKLREPVIRFLHLLRGTNGFSETGIYPIEGLASPEYGVGQLHFYSPSVFNFYPPNLRRQRLCPNRKRNGSLQTQIGNKNDRRQHTIYRKTAAVFP